MKKHKKGKKRLKRERKQSRNVKRGSGERNDGFIAEIIKEIEKET